MFLARWQDRRWRRLGLPVQRTIGMHADEESHGCLVPRKASNNAYQATASR